MKTGIYGGSFNPIHFGHIGLVKWIKEHTDLDEVWMMVTPNNPLKDSSVLADEQTRLREAKNAVKDIPGVKVSDFEFTLPRPSYTANTLRELRKAYPEREFTLIIGEDNWAIFESWREWQYILDNYRIFVYPRRNTVPVRNDRAGQVQFMNDAPYFDISSTEIREKQIKNKNK